jgi:hypothetical protein
MKRIVKERERITLSLPADLVERLRTVVYWTPSLTLAGAIKSAIHSELKKLEKGRRFRKRKGKLPVGRPRKQEPSR